MFLDAYYQRDGDTISVSRPQASRFAKDIAGDFNPIHDTDARRFCVPGDLLFAIVLTHYGLAASMRFHFQHMLSADNPVLLPSDPGETIELRDHQGACYLSVARAGSPIKDADVIERFIRQYVAFSGHNFPHYLKPLMQAEGVMFNPQRPFVIYDRMDFELTNPAMNDPEVGLSDSQLSVQGRRGDARLDFAIHDGGKPIGSGSKNLVISGLQPYDDERMASVIEAFNARRDNHQFGD
jgi:hypothetical protein